METCGFSFIGNAINLSETLTESTDNVSEELLEESLRLCRHDVALHEFCTFIDYTPCCGEGNRVDKSVAQHARQGAQIETKVICLTELERRGGHRQTFCAYRYAYFLSSAIIPAV